MHSFQRIFLATHAALSSCAGRLVATDQDTLLISEGQVHLVDVPAHMLSRIQMGRVVRARLDEAGKGYSKRPHVIEMQPVSKDRHGGRKRRLQSTLSGSPMPGLALPAAAGAENLFSDFYSQPAMRGANISAVFMIVSMCGQPPSISRADLEALLFDQSQQQQGGGGGGGAANLTLQGHFSSCSGGAACLSALVIDKITLPCSGSSVYGPWCV